MNEQKFIEFCEEYDIAFRDVQRAFAALAQSAEFERYEFLGDSILNMIISDELCRRFSEEVGALAKMKSYLVSGHTFAQVAQELGLASVLEQGIGTPRKAEDLFEAFVGVLYRDRGLRYTRRVVLRFLKTRITTAYEDYLNYDYKSRIQELSQKRYGELPEFVVVKEEGPEHHKLFEVNLYVHKKLMGIGTGYSKKEAQQAAAKEALLKIKNGGDAKWQ